MPPRRRNNPKKAAPTSNHTKAQNKPANPQSPSANECPEWLLYSVYSMIDNFENQNALNALTKLLLKYPKSQLVRGLKAIVQMRLGQKSVAYDLACQVMNETPDQLIVLQTLLYTFRPLGKFHDIEIVYRQAYLQNPRSEDLATHLVHALLRQFKYSEMHSMVMQCKSKFSSTSPESKLKYQYWYALTTFLQSKYSTDQDDRHLLKQVNYKYVTAQFATKGSFASYDQVRLFLTIVRLAGHAPTALTESVIVECLNCVPHTLLDANALLLEYLSAGTELLSVCMAVLESNPDDWHAWTKYMECTAALSIAECEIHEFMTKLQSAKQPAVRGPYLAPVVHAYTTCQKSNTRALEALWTAFGGKQVFYMDIERYLIKHDTDAIQWVHGLVVEIIPVPKHVIRAANWRKLRRFYSLDNSMGDLYTEYCVAHALDLEMQLVDTEARLADAFVLLAVLYLLDARNFQACVLAMAILESALVRSPSNAVFKILLISLYLDMGAPTRALALYTQLDIKHIQLDTHSYHLLDRLASVGGYADAFKFAKQVLTIYTSNQQETPEIIVEAFQLGTYTKVDEFVEFYNRLQYSVNRGVAIVEYWRSTVLHGLDSKMCASVPYIGDTAPQLEYPPEAYVYDNRDRSIVPKSACSLDGGLDSLQYKICGFHLVRQVIESILSLRPEDQVLACVDELSAWCARNVANKGGVWSVGIVVRDFARAVLMGNSLGDSSEVNDQFDLVVEDLNQHIQAVQALVVSEGHVSKWVHSVGKVFEMICTVIESMHYVRIMTHGIQQKLSVPNDPGFVHALNAFTHQLTHSVAPKLELALMFVQERLVLGPEMDGLFFKDVVKGTGDAGLSAASVWFDEMVSGEAVELYTGAILSDWDCAISGFRDRVICIRG